MDKVTNSTLNVLKSQIDQKRFKYQNIFNMKRSTFLSLFLFLAFAINLSAQSTNEARAVKSTERMNKQIDLSEEQKKAVKAGYLEMYRQITELREIPSACFPSEICSG